MCLAKQAKDFTADPTCLVVDPEINRDRRPKVGDSVLLGFVDGKIWVYTKSKETGSTQSHEENRNGMFSHLAVVVKVTPAGEDGKEVWTVIQGGAGESSKKQEKIAGSDMTLDIKTLYNADGVPNQAGSSLRRVQGWIDITDMIDK